MDLHAPVGGVQTAIQERVVNGALAGDGRVGIYATAEARHM